MEKGMLREERFIMKSHIDKTPLSIIQVIPMKEVRAVIQIFHGRDDTKEDYLSFMEFLAQHGFVVVAYDMRGHGESILEGSTPSYYGKHGAKACIEDTNQVSRMIRKRFRGIPYYLIGYDLGATIVKNYLKRHDRVVDGVILIGSIPSIRFAKIGMYLAKWGSVFLGDHASGEKLSRFGGGVVKLDASLNTYETLLRLQHGAYDTNYWHVNKKQLPIWILQGKEEHAEANRMFPEVGYTNVSYHSYKRMGHDLLHEKDAIKVYLDIATRFEIWLDRIY